MTQEQQFWLEPPRLGRAFAKPAGASSIIRPR
ncbi:hypothetical protein V3C99_017072 [Haemonchus contortus]